MISSEMLATGDISVDMLATNNSDTIVTVTAGEWTTIDNINSFA